MPAPAHIARDEVFFRHQTVLRAGSKFSKRPRIVAEPSADCRSAAGSRHEAVSYTHLDVYKRQATDGASDLTVVSVRMRTKLRERLQGALNRG